MDPNVRRVTNHKAHEGNIPLLQHIRGNGGALASVWGAPMSSIITAKPVTAFWIRTAVGCSIGCWQVGTSLPGLGFEALPAALAVLAGSVVFTLALEDPILHQALGGMEVTLTPSKTKINT